MFACRKKDSRYAKLLIKNGVSLDTDYISKSPLSYACGADNGYMIGLLLDHGYSLDELQDSYELQSTQKKSILQILKHCPEKVTKKYVRELLRLPYSCSDIDIIYNVINCYGMGYKACNETGQKVNKFIKREKTLKKILSKYISSDVLYHIMFKYTNFIELTEIDKPTKRFKVSDRYIYCDTGQNIRCSLRKIKEKNTNKCALI